MSDVTLNTDPLDRESIAALAYRLWQQRGCPQGSGEDDWLQAEALLRAESLRQSAATLQAHADAPFPEAAAGKKSPRTAKTPPHDGGAAARKTRVTRARPARPDA